MSDGKSDGPFEPGPPVRWPDDVMEAAVKTSISTGISVSDNPNIDPLFVFVMTYGPVTIRSAVGVEVAERFARHVLDTVKRIRGNDPDVLAPPKPGPEPVADGTTPVLPFPIKTTTN